MPPVENLTDTDDSIRQKAETLLKDGLETEAYPRADDQEQVVEIVTRLQKSDGSLEQRLIIGGFTLDSIEYEEIEQACETCMYYLVHRRYCELPELDVPVEAEWSCRLWRI